MGKRSTAGSPRKGQFFGIGKDLGPRRQNGFQGPSKKWIPYVRKDQKGTVWETLIHEKFRDILDQRNDPNYAGGDRMYQNDASGRLASHWEGVNHKGINAKASQKYIRERGGTHSEAREYLHKLSGISFGTDPKTK